MREAARTRWTRTRRGRGRARASSGDGDGSESEMTNRAKLSDALADAELLRRQSWRARTVRSRGSSDGDRGGAKERAAAAQAAAAKDDPEGRGGGEKKLARGDGEGATRRPRGSLTRTRGT